MAWKDFKEGDWVALPDNKFGRITIITGAYCRVEISVNGKKKSIPVKLADCLRLAR